MPEILVGLHVQQIFGFFHLGVIPAVYSFCLFLLLFLSKMCKCFDFDDYADV